MTCSCVHRIIILEYSFPRIYCARFNVNEYSRRVFATSTRRERSPRVLAAVWNNGVVRIDPLRFLTGWHKRRLNQALSVLVSLSLGFLSVLYCCSVWPLFVLHCFVFCTCSVTWLLWFGCQYHCTSASDWLQRLVSEMAYNDKVYSPNTKYIQKKE